MRLHLDREDARGRMSVGPGLLFCKIAKAIRPMLLLTALAWAPGLAKAEGAEGLQLEPLPDELKEAMAQAGYRNVEFLVIATPEKIDSFIGAGVGGLIEKQEALKPGDFSVSLPYGFDFGEKEPGFRAIVIHSGSPGSGNDCRRAGTCKSATSG
jgi:hypothetical protein